MRNSAHFGRRRAIAAVVLSLILHGSAVVAWFSIRPVHGRPDGLIAGTAVDSPDDGKELEITLRTPPSPIPPRPIIEPPKLPAAVTVPPLSVPGPGPGVVQASEPPAAPMPASSSQGGKPLHGKLKPGKMVAYVLDCSSSMGSDGRLRAACDALKASLQQLPGDCRFQIVAYNANAHALANQPIPATDGNRDQAGRWLDALMAEGSSNHLAGLREALWQQPDAVFLITDADDLGEKEAKAIAGIVRSGVMLNAVLIGSSPTGDETPLRRLCERTGGGVVGRK